MYHRPPLGGSARAYFVLHALTRVNRSLTPAGCPAGQFHPGTVNLDTAMDPTDDRAHPDPAASPGSYALDEVARNESPM